MISSTFFRGAILSLGFSSIATSQEIGIIHVTRSELIQIPVATRVPIPIVPTISAKINNIEFKLNTSTGYDRLIVAPAAPAAAVTVRNTKNTVLIFARDADSSYSAFSGLNGYGIPYQVVNVPVGGAKLPVLNSSATVGNYGAIVVLSEVSYENSKTGTFDSALTTAQWASLYQYQVSFGIRMVRLDALPGSEFGTSALGACCDNGVEQLLTITDSSAFPTSGLKTGVGLSTDGLYHYPASITDKSIATEFAQFATAKGFKTKSTAAVINTFSGRQQMVWFIGFATDWSATSAILNHAWITWVTRGLYAGYRRINLNTQVDDMFLITDLYYPSGSQYAVKPTDLAVHVDWMDTVNAKLPPGSKYFIEIGHNGNGNIEDSVATDKGEKACGIGPIYYDELPSTPLEFVKKLGTGTNLWPSTPASYPYKTACTDLDALKKWWSTPENRDAFAHVSHTFTHEAQNNATYFDVTREISWNQAWFAQTGIADATMFSPNGIIPPAITGLHNGDALRAWLDNGIKYVVGDNTRPPLLNTQNEHWPLITTVAANGYAGVQINPRWALNIYYNCAVPDCTTREWKETGGGMPKTTINGVSTKYSLLQAWVETIVQELIRVVNWPIISLKHDDMALGFLNRMKRDACKPVLTYVTNPTAKTITGVTLSATGNTCSEKIPVTVPGSVTDTQDFDTEQIVIWLRGLVHTK
ncbi:hypothetical protein M7I_1877 [Glarea lozoyensis 74030]|uniref:Extracellular serine-rich protein n=1 Tax=Glarea lozoyensis (strain ATCC 74030 / MF5533) TaxID=1104152 RepID=H0EHA0_GLAL7|nr:hypothetical protein M7I_1877 [Glarea lozoyensis 74030]